MTVRQIADAVGRPEKTVRNWVKRVAIEGSSMAAKLAVSTSTYPADYDLDETCKIITIGLGRNAAGLYRENALRSVPAPVSSAEALALVVRETVTAMLPVLMAAVRGLVPEQALALPPAATLSSRDQLRRVINTAAGRLPGGHRAAWNELYSQYYYRYHRNLRECAKNRSMDTLDYADDEGALPELLSLAVTLYGAAS